MNESIPCLVFEDDHLLVVHKPAGLNTHAPAPYAGEGLYDWLRHREPRWSRLAIIHRLDKDTSGLIVFSKTPEANRSLTDQFTRRLVRKTYLLLTDRPTPAREWSVQSRLVRTGSRYTSADVSGLPAETRFRVLQNETAGQSLIEAEPVTGRTHQIRVHAADRGVPIVGDSLYGGTSSHRLCLHAAEIAFQHPESGEPMHFRVPPAFEQDPSIALREALIDPRQTDGFRLVHGASDGAPGWFVDRLGEFALVSLLRAGDLPAGRRQWLEAMVGPLHLRGVYHRHLVRQPGPLDLSDVSPKHLLGEAAPDEFQMIENGVKFALRFEEGSSFGLFLDQRDNRRRLITRHVAAEFPLFARAASRPEVLNTFAYTCGFSVCAALGGARTTSLDLSRKYLDWGKGNFRRNDLDPDAHDFIYGDALDWMARFARKKRQFDLVLLDPPTFSRSKETGVFRVESDYGRLVRLALPLVKKGGVLFASTNAAKMPPETFAATAQDAVRAGGRRIQQVHYVPQPPDFPISREEPAYLKTLWLRLE